VNFVLERFCELVRAHADFDRRHGRMPLSCFPASPRYLWQAFARATPLPNRDDRSTQAFGPITLALNLDEDPFRFLNGSGFRTPRILKRPRFHRLA